ncbi:hypothetical protein B1806_04535 [Metallibacterium scheffleri]|uniref:Uncharacterized protein n=2 Tax=Metallibacterium scheffleri TaxID=993689 RepID=A0A4S3KSC4_9GAMM|nr:hypothetical protein B1806_04535 [Metallibacterium scheffleri]
MIDRTMLDVGAILYRTVGLLVDAKNLHDGVTTHDGVITNRLIGDGLYFERRSPNSYTSESEWRASMAVLKEWNGDFGYIMVRLKHTTPAITGQVSLQRLPRMGPRMVLPGGGSQVYIPHLCLEDVEVVLSDGSVGALAAHSLSDIIHETRFGSDGASL